MKFLLSVSAGHRKGTIAIAVSKKVVINRRSVTRDELWSPVLSSDALQAHPSPPPPNPLSLIHSCMLGGHSRSTKPWHVAAEAGLHLLGDVATCQG